MFVGLFAIICPSHQRKQWHPTLVLLPGKSHGRRSLEGCIPWGRWGSDTTKWLHFHLSLSHIGEGNGNPLQCSCQKNPRDGGALWAAVYGVAQSRMQQMQLSSSSSNPFHKSMNSRKVGAIILSMCLKRTRESLGTTLDRWWINGQMDDGWIQNTKKQNFPSIGIRNGAKMQAQSLQLVKLALLHVVIIHCHQQQQTVGVHTHTHTHTHTLSHFPHVWTSRGMDSMDSRRAPKSTLLT